MSEYVPSQTVSKVSKEDIEAVGSSEKYVKLKTKLASFKSVLEASQFWTQCRESIDAIPRQLQCIRCLALGSPSESTNALYQLALIILIGQHLKISNISFYDPVFTSSDILLLEHHLEYSVTATEPDAIKIPTLLYLPHAPLALTNVILDEINPQYLLGNDIVSHTDRYTRAKLAATYPTISLLANLAEPAPVLSEFTPVSRRRKKKVFVEPEVEYDYNQTYFDDLKITRYSAGFEKKSPWGDSFSDLALHEIKRKEESIEEEKNKEKKAKGNEDKSNEDENKEKEKR